MAKVDKRKALDLRLNHGLSTGEIAKMQGVSRQAICSALQGLISNKDEFERLRKSMPDVLSGTALTMLERYNSLTAEEQKDLVRRRGMVDFGILYDKHRVETGQSVVNIAYSEVKTTINKLDTEIQAIEAELANLDGDTA